MSALRLSQQAAEISSLRATLDEKERDLAEARADHADQLRACADLIERFAKLKEHAEAAAEYFQETADIDPNGFKNYAMEWLDAYRRDFPKEEK